MFRTISGSYAYPEIVLRSVGLSKGFIQGFIEGGLGRMAY